MRNICEKIKSYYDSELWSINRVKNMVIKGIITEEEYKEITEEDYQD